MGKLMNRSDSYPDCKMDESGASMSPSLTPTSPLDLSIRSKRYPFTPRPASPLDLSIKPGSIFARQMSVEPPYEPPVVLIQPKSEWHYRSLKDLAKNHLPFLAANGRQRTPIQVSVPGTFNESLYLAISVWNMRDRPHRSKVIVPAGTTVTSAHLPHDNDLSCLKFDENSTNHVDLYERRIYSKISAEEQRARVKDVRVHMFNLYQNQDITKELIEAEQLSRCKLSFQLYIHENGQFIPVSRPSLSVIIEEKKMTSRVRPADQRSFLSVSPLSSTRSGEGDSPQDDDD